MHTVLAWTRAPKADGGVGNVKFPLVADVTKKMSRDFGMQYMSITSVCTYVCMYVNVKFPLVAYVTKKMSRDFGMQYMSIMSVCTYVCMYVNVKFRVTKKNVR